MNKNIKKKIKLLLKCCYRYGFIDGLKLFYDLSGGKLDNIKPPAVKFPLFLRPGTSDVPTFHQIFLEGEYDIRFKEKPNIIIDGGANIGLFAIKMKSDYPAAKIICIEPDPDNFKVLKRNLDFYGDSICENCGLWDNDTKLKVYNNKAGGKWAMQVMEDLHGGNVDAISMSTLFKKYSIDKVDILKLDIEASEKQLFSHNFEEWLPKVKTIVIELHDFMEEGCSKPFFEAINKCFINYKYSSSGEHTIITNLDT